MKTEVDKHKTAFIKERIAELQKTNSRLTFREAWNAVQKEHPDWMSSENDEPKRSWQDQLPPSHDQLNGKVNAGDWLDLHQVCKDLRIAIRIEASRSDGPGYLERSDEHGRLLREYAEVLGYYVERI